MSITKTNEFENLKLPLCTSTSSPTLFEHQSINQFRAVLCTLARSLAQGQQASNQTGRVLPHELKDLGLSLLDEAELHSCGRRKELDSIRLNRASVGTCFSYSLLCQSAYAIETSPSHQTPCFVD